MKSILFSGLVGAGVLLSTPAATAQDAPKAEKQQQRIVIKKQQQAEKKSAQLMERAMKLSQKASELAAAGKTEQAADAAAKAAELLRKAAADDAVEAAQAAKMPEGKQKVRVGDEVIEFRVHAEDAHGMEHALHDAYEHVAELHEHLGSNAERRVIRLQGHDLEDGRIELDVEALIDGELQSLEGLENLNVQVLDLTGMPKLNIEQHMAGLDLEKHIAAALGDLEGEIDVRVLHGGDLESLSEAHALQWLEAPEGAAHAFALAVPGMTAGEGAYTFEWNAESPFGMDCECEEECEDCEDCECGSTVDVWADLAIAGDGQSGVWLQAPHSHGQQGAVDFWNSEDENVFFFNGQEEGQERIHILGGQGGTIHINGGEDGQQHIYIYGGSAMPQPQQKAELRVRRFPAPSAPANPGKTLFLPRYEVETEDSEPGVSAPRIRLQRGSVSTNAFPTPLRGKVKTEDGKVIEKAVIRATDASAPAPSKTEDAEAIIREMRAEMEALRQELQDLRRQMKDDPLVRSDLREGAWRSAAERNPVGDAARAVSDRRRAGLGTR